ncbi:MAG TPA: carboxypeptidase-like regulatory domain-containing protein [Verrucomicrobiae bacterium]
MSASSVQSDANTTVTHTITGIAQGETVTVERFADLNNNGSIDFGEPPLRSFVVKDGVRPTIGAIVNGNVPGDDDGAANGSIRIDLPFPGVDVFMNRQPGKYIIRVTGASGQATAPFEITAPNLSQRVTGFLKNSSNNATISFGIVVILVGQGEPIGSIRTDGTGQYTFVAPPGDYALIPISDGFIAPMQFVSIPPNQTVNQNLTLTPATVRVSGKLSDASTSAGVPSVFILAQAGNDQSQLISGALTDSNGNYSFSLTAGDWEVGPLSLFTSQLGYVSQKHSAVITVASSPITQNISVQKATALIYGKITNPSNAAVPGLALRAQDQNAGLESEGRSNASGDYFIGTLGGNWDGETEGASALGFRDETKSFALAGGDTTKWDIHLASFTAHVRGRVVDGSGNGIPNVTIQGRYEQSQQSSSQSGTAQDGSFDLPVWGGNWSIDLNDDAGYINHTIQLTVVDGVDQTITFVVPNSTGQISGTVKNSSNQGIPGVFVSANATINGVNYHSGSQTDSTGHYQLPAINGNWGLSLSCDDLQSQNYDCPQTQFATINNNNATVNFNLTTFVVTASINGKVVDGSGAGLSGVQIGAINQGSNNSRSSTSGPDGSFSIPVYAGQWSLQLFNPSPNYIAPVQQITVTDGVNVNNVQFKVLQADATITGTLKSSTGAAVSGIRIYASATVGNVNYFVPVSTTDPSGNFSFTVSRGTWNLSVDCNDLDAQNFTCAGIQAVDTSSGSATPTITVTPKVSTPLQIDSPTLDQSGQIPIFRFALHGSSGTYDIYGTPALGSPWTLVATTTISFGGNVANPEFNPGSNHFFRVQLHQ